nr:putative transporter mch1 [Quercus suber]
MTLVLSGFGDLLVAFPIPSSVYIASLIIGFSYGTQLTLLFTIISELFGLKYYSTLFNCGQLASPLGSYVFNVQVVAKLYDKEALKQLAVKGMTRSMVRELTCMGKECYRLSFVILAGANFFGALVLFVLVMRTRDFL